MKELLFFLAGLIIGAALLFVVFELWEFPGEGEYKRQIEGLDESLQAKDRQILGLNNELSALDYLIEKNKVKIENLQQKRDTFKNLNLTIPEDKDRRKALIDSVLNVANK